MRKTIIHSDNTVSYWSPMMQLWRSRVPAEFIGDAELATLTNRDFKRIVKAAEEARRLRAEW